ncbi:MAG: hypothetical protein AAFX79_02580 [Planctomycetota bacterium]
MAALDAEHHIDPGPDLVTAELHRVGPREPVEGVVRSNEICTASGKAASFVRHIEIDVGGTPLARSFVAGQSFGVHPPGENERGRPHALRLYSLASPTRGEDGEGGVIATTVKRLIDERSDGPGLFTGVASNYLCDLRPGDRLRVSGPNGKRFVLPARPEEHDYVFFATGTGIAPFRGMVLELLERAPESRIALVMGAPYATDLLYDGAMRALDAEHANFSYLPTVSRQPQRDGAGPMYVQDRLEHDADLLGEILRSDRGLIYVCGLLGMELGIAQRLARRFAGDALERYLRIDPEVADDIDGWTRKMIHRKVKPTRRMFVEVY